MNASVAPKTDCSGDGAGDKDHGVGTQSGAPAKVKLVFERQGELARELLCCMFETGTMADVEIIIDESCSIRSHTEVLVRVSGYFRTLLKGSHAYDSLVLRIYYL